MEVYTTVLNYPFLKIVALPLWILLVLLLLHLDLSHWNGLMGSISHPGLGENGTGSYLSVPSSEIVAYTQGWQRYGYNAWLAERISLFRSLPDLRDPRCEKFKYYDDPDVMKPASIVLIFRNEQLMVLLRTLHSLVVRTPSHLYVELILVNDHSDMDFWKEKLSVFLFETYVLRYIHSKARIIHLNKKVGLIKARNFAANLAKGENLVFVDAQVEFTEGWLVPLLETISEQSLTLATPILDKLDEQNLAYHRSEERLGIYDWSLRRREVPLTKDGRYQLPRPYGVAAVRTSVFAIRTLWFQDLSNFDTELQGFGGAELELSFKVWRSGGRIVQVPCSRVGHLQPTDQDYLRRYGDLYKISKKVTKNLKRIVELWIDDPILKSTIYRYQPHLINISVGDLRESRKLYQQYDCQSFKSFINDVMPELWLMKPLNRTDFAMGNVRPLEHPQICLTVSAESKFVVLEPCKANNTLQNWTLSYLNDLRVVGNICAEVQSNLQLGYNFCHNLGGRQSLHFDEVTNQLVSNTKCLEFGSKVNIFMGFCNAKNKKQKWILDNINLSVMQNGT
ncbi:putative polypeptide N-acetylgalactosaminyltransferase 12 [Drosophila eugracilis]|uniref:putative polypeptide N-acetylgalactosaminyltransferase 12 n=1 Tax=Drosophila eugracilis TaxID=29029 RepID=UPI0007E8337B|nr:putative polypeptide N-acetylgalactosaminyltransferase 12 [Drosophila eugracilis]